MLKNMDQVNKRVKKRVLHLYRINYNISIPNNRENPFFCLVTAADKAHIQWLKARKFQKCKDIAS